MAAMRPEEEEAQDPSVIPLKRREMLSQ